MEIQYKTKLVSLNPDMYEMRSIERLKEEYQTYLGYCEKAGYKAGDKRIKDFETWRLTEI